MPDSNSAPAVILTSPVRGAISADGRGVSVTLPGWRSRLRMPAEARGQYLLLAYAAVSVVGVINLFEQDLYGLALIAAAVVGVWLLDRRWFHAFVWSWLIVLGVVGLIELDFTHLVTIALGIIGLLVGLSRPQVRFAGVALPRPIRVSSNGAQAALLPIVVADAPMTNNGTSVTEAPGEPALLRVLTIGRLQIFTRGTDVTQQLVSKPTLSFVFLYLLTRAIQSPGSTILRQSLAQEVSPGLPSTQQLRRLRSTMHDIQRKLPAELADRVKVDGDTISLDLTGVELDVNWLRWYKSSARDRALLDPDLERRLAAHLESMASGEFLPGWEDIEQKANNARGVAGDLVRDIRREVDQLRCDLALALARSYLASGQAAKATQPLELVLPIAADRDDLHRLLVWVYQQTGQHAKASKLAAQLRAAEEV
jgi:hypothetical protein